MGASELQFTKAREVFRFSSGNSKSIRYLSDISEKAISVQ